MSHDNHYGNYTHYGLYTCGSFIFCLVLVGCFLSAVMFAALAFAQENTIVSGLTEPIKDVILSAEAGGKIVKIHYQEGDSVAKGCIILELKKNFEELEVERRKLIWEDKAEVNSASERVATLKSIFDMTRSLFEQRGSVSREELEKIELDYKLAIAEQERLQSAEERERIEYHMAIENQEKLILKSNLNGIITELLVDEGENCEANQPLVRVVDCSKCILVCYIKAPLGEKLKKGQVVNLEIPVGSQSVRRKGRIIFVSPVVDPASDLITVKVEFANPGGSIRPGVAASMVIPGP